MAADGAIQTQFTANTAFDGDPTGSPSCGGNLVATFVIRGPSRTLVDAFGVTGSGDV